MDAAEQRRAQAFWDESLAMVIVVLVIVELSYSLVII